MSSFEHRFPKHWRRLVGQPLLAQNGAHGIEVPQRSEASATNREVLFHLQSVGGIQFTVVVGMEKGLGLGAIHGRRGSKGSLESGITGERKAFNKTKTEERVHLFPESFFGGLWEFFERTGGSRFVSQAI